MGMKAWGNKATGQRVHVQWDAGRLSPKESIVMSVLTLCIPGIIYNLNKLRQIECMYVTCLEDYAKQGLPVKACEDQRSYATCKYWWGEIFQLLPFTGLINAFVGLIKRALSSPYGFIDIVLGYTCTYIIESPDGVGASVCLINDIAGLIADVVADLEGIGETWEIQGDYCKNI